MPVIVKPITLFTDTYETFQTRAQEYAQEVTDSVMNGEEMPTDAEMQNQIYQIYYDVLKERVDSGMLYGGARNLELHVTKESSREFAIVQDDMDKLDSMLIESVDTGEENEKGMEQEPAEENESTGGIGRKACHIIQNHGKIRNIPADFSCRDISGKTYVFAFNVSTSFFKSNTSWSTTVIFSSSSFRMRNNV